MKNRKISLIFLCVILLTFLNIYLQDSSIQSTSVIEATINSIGTIFGNANILSPFEESSKRVVYFITLLITAIVWFLLSDLIIEILNHQLEKVKIERDLKNENNKNIFFTFREPDSIIVSTIIESIPKNEKYFYYTNNPADLTKKIKKLPQNISISHRKNDIHIDITQEVVTVNFYNYTRVLQRSMIESRSNINDNNLYQRILDNQRRPMILMIGEFDATTEDLFKRLVVSLQSPFGKPKFVFYIKNSRMIETFHKIRFEELHTVADLSYFDLVDFVTDADSDYDFIYLMNLDEYFELQIIDLIQLTYYEKINSISIYSNSDRTKLLYSDFVSPLSEVEKSYSYSVIVENSLDYLPKKIDEQYRGAHSQEYIWDKLSDFIKESNRSAADFERNFFLLRDYGFSEWKIAEIEHLRWNAFHFVHGWKKMNFKEAEDRYNLGILEYRKNILYRQHLALVSWTDLLEVDNFVSQLEGKDHSFQQADISNVRTILEQNIPCD